MYNNMYMYIILEPNLQVDSNSFFLHQSYGANSEVAGIVTLLAVIEQLGRLKRSDTVCQSPCACACVHACVCTCTCMCTCTYVYPWKIVIYHVIVYSNFHMQAGVVGTNRPIMYTFHGVSICVLIYI